MHLQGWIIPLFLRDADGRGIVTVLLTGVLVEREKRVSLLVCLPASSPTPRKSRVNCLGSGLVSLLGVEEAGGGVDKSWFA